MQFFSTITVSFFVILGASGRALAGQAGGRGGRPGKFFHDTAAFNHCAVPGSQRSSAKCRPTDGAMPATAAACLSDSRWKAQQALWEAPDAGWQGVQPRIALRRHSRASNAYSQNNRVRKHPGLARRSEIE
jgi:hypothetical protein